MKKYVFKGGYAFREFFKKRVQNKDEINQKSPKPNSKPKPDSKPESTWVTRIRKCLQTENIAFKEKFRKFPIIDEGQYIPKFILNEVSHNTKHVVVDICETQPTKDNTYELRSFINMYGTQYHVVLVVYDGYLREWNEYNRDLHIFDDIWTSDSISALANYLQSIIERGGGGYVQKKFARCEPPKGCGKTATGHDEVGTVFGYQKNNDGKMAVHSYCRKCRRNKNCDEPRENPDDWQAKNTYCTGCKSTFVPARSSQSHCESCLQEFR